MVAVHFNAPTSLFIVAGGAAVKTQSLCFFFLSLSRSLYYNAARRFVCGGNTKQRWGNSIFFFHGLDA